MGKKMEVLDYEGLKKYDEEIKKWTQRKADEAELQEQARNLEAATADIVKIQEMIKSGDSLDGAKAALLALGENYADLFSLASLVKSFLTASDTKDTTINTWQEIETFLQGITDKETLTGLLTNLETKITEAYQSAIKDIDLTSYAKTTDLSKYLPLTGGTMANTNMVKNLNAEMIGGKTLAQIEEEMKSSGGDVDLTGYVKTEEFEEAKEELEGMLEGKADRSELSNVLGEEVIDDDTLEGFGILTREQLKKDLFIDMWNEACRSNYNGATVTIGKYNEQTGFFELNGLTDITYEQALTIYNHGKTEYPNPSNIGDNCRTNLFVAENASRFGKSYWYVYFRSFVSGYISSKIEVLRIAQKETDFVQAYTVSPFMRNARNLKKIIGILDMEYTQEADYNNSQNFNCENVEEFKISRIKNNFKIPYLKSLNLESYKYMVQNANNSKAITITVHADVYAKITDTGNAEWNNLIALAQEKNITFASA